MSEQPDTAHVAEPQTGDDGIITHTVLSPFQAGETNMHVLLPDHIREGSTYPVIFLLPVASLDHDTWGDPIREVARLDLHNQHSFIGVMPTFAQAPWYADHPTNAGMRHESHLLRVIVPFVDRTYPVNTQGAGRLLLGFSKSGWGAYSLLLRNPHLFQKAVAWDSPLGQSSPTKYGMREAFPTQDHLDRYAIWEMLKTRGSELGSETRLALMGYGVFRAHHQATHYYMVKHAIDHHYVDGPRREHRWDSGWLPEAVAFLRE